MSESSIEKDVLEFLARNFPLKHKWRNIDTKDSLIDAGVIDSTGVLELVEFLESHFGIVIHFEELLPENLDTIESISRYVFSKLNGTGSNAAA